MAKDSIHNELVEQISNVIYLFKLEIRDTVFEAVQYAMNHYNEEKVPERMFSREEVCQIFQISKPTLWDATKKGYIVPTRIGRRVLYSQTALNDYMLLGSVNQKFAAKEQKEKERKGSLMQTYIMYDHALRYYKIGISIHPKFRESTLQAEKPSIELMYVCLKNVEKELHEKYASKRIRGEWFSINEKDVEEIVQQYKFYKV